MTLDAALTLPAGTVLSAPVYDGDRVVYKAGALLDEAVTLSPGMRLGAGTRLNEAVAIQAMTWPAGIPLPRTPVPGALTDVVVQNGDLPLLAGALLPSGADVKLAEGVSSIDLRSHEDGHQGRNWAIAGMLPESSLSWSLRLVAGADTTAADTRAISSGPARNARGNLVLADAHYGLNIQQVPGKTVWSETNQWFLPPGQEVLPEELEFCLPGDCVVLPPSTSVTALDPVFSVLRTGTGDLDLLAGADFRMLSTFGVYTAGTQSAAPAGGAASYNQSRGGYLPDTNSVLGPNGSDYERFVDGGSDSTYAANYPWAGGNVLLRTGGDIVGDSLSAKSGAQLYPNDRVQQQNAGVGNWLWRQGSGSGADGAPVAWWINFGTYTHEPFLETFGNVIDDMPYLSGFTGIGTLGGGNLTVDAGGNAGTITRRGDAGATEAPRSEGLILAVGSTGRVDSTGQLVLTGGGDLNIRVGGGLNRRTGCTERRMVNSSTI